MTFKPSLITRIGLILVAIAGSAPGAAQDQAAGTLQDQQRIYMPQGCLLAGGRAVCAFSFVNRGEPATLQAMPTAKAELSQLQMIDDAHVPHAADTSYFVDKFGNRQPQLFIGKADEGMYVAEFPNVDARVTSAQFQRQGRLVGPVVARAAAPAPAPVQVPAPMQAPAPVAAPAPVQQPGNTVFAAATSQQQQMAAQQQAAARMAEAQARAQQEQAVMRQLASQSQEQNILMLQCMQAGSANSALCKAASGVSDAQAKVSSVNTTVDQARSTVNQAGESAKMVKGFFSELKDMLPKKEAPADAAAQPQAPGTQPAAPASR
jgi:hypothetical protein